MKHKLLFPVLALTILLSSCSLFEDDSELIKGKHEYFGGSMKIKVGSTSETIGDGSIEADFDKGSITVFGIGEKNDVHIVIESGFEGAGKMEFSAVKPTIADGGDKNFNIYSWDASRTGSLTVSEVTEDFIKGTYSFSGAEIVTGQTKTVSGEFSILKK